MGFLLPSGFCHGRWREPRTAAPAVRPRVVTGAPAPSPAPAPTAGNPAGS